MKITAAQQINYEPGTDRIEPRSRTFLARGGKKGDNLVIAEIQRAGYEVISRQIVGWGMHNAIIRVDPLLSEQVGGYYLVKLDDHA